LFFKLGLKGSNLANSHEFGPGLSQDYPFHNAIEIHSHNHDPPPGGILTKSIRGQLAAGKIVFHHRVRLFGLPAALAR